MLPTHSVKKSVFSASQILREIKFHENSSGPMNVLKWQFLACKNPEIDFTENLSGRKFPKCPQYALCNNPMWKFKNFCATQILREIKGTSKCPFWGIQIKAVNFDFGENVQFLKAENYLKSISRKIWVAENSSNFYSKKFSNCWWLGICWKWYTAWASRFQGSKTLQNSIPTFPSFCYLTAKKFWHTTLSIVFSSKRNFMKTTTKTMI